MPRRSKGAAPKEFNYRIMSGSLKLAEFVDISEVRHFVKMLCCSYEVNVRKGDEWFYLPLC